MTSLPRVAPDLDEWPAIGAANRRDDVRITAPFVEGVAQRFPAGTELAHELRNLSHRSAGWFVPLRACLRGASRSSRWPSRRAGFSPEDRDHRLWPSPGCFRSGRGASTLSRSWWPRSASNLHDEAGVDRVDRQLPDDWIGEILEGRVHWYRCLALRQLGSWAAM